MKKILYIGWIGFNNLGDELLWNQFKGLCDKYLDANEFQIIPSRPGIDINNTDPYDAIVLGGGSLLLPGYVKVLYEAKQKGKKTIIWGSGVDWIGKEELDQYAIKEIVDLSKNFKTHDKNLIKETIHQADFVGVRGPLTKKTLNILEVPDEQFQIIGDPGLLLDSPPSSKKEKIIGINFGTTYNRLYGANEKKLEDNLAKAANKLIEKGYTIYLYAVWGEDRRNCQSLMQKINQPEHVIFDSKLYNEKELMALLSTFSLTINFKLHSNVLSLSAGTPAIFLGYRFKVFDMAASLHLENFVLSTDLPAIDQAILTKVEEIEKNGGEIMKQYKQYQAYYSPLLLEPFQKNFYLKN